MLLPPRLQPGDTIGVVTPSAPISSSPSPAPLDELQRGMDFLTGLGFRVVLGEHALTERGYSAGTPQERAQDINAMFADPAIRAIISSHGGTTVNSCLNYLDWELIRRHPKIVMGFSDLTVLIMALYARAGLVAFHGNMVIWHLGMNPTDYDRQELLDRLVRGKIGPIRKNSEWRTIRGSGSVEGRLLGGHLGQLTLMFGTPYWPQVDQAILFLEFTRYEPDVLEARFEQMRQMGMWQYVRGVVIGHVAGAPADPDDQPEQILRRVTTDLQFPIVKNDDFGHNCPNTVLPVGVRARLNADAAELEILEPCVQ